VLAVTIALTPIAHAEGNMFSFNLTTLIADSLANLFYSFQTMASWLVYLAGSLMNFSINLTMHIKEFVASTDAIYTVWKAIRDISGMFIIFGLLYSAIQLITGFESPKFGDRIKNIVVAGILINFSFFLTGLAIDVSNIVSLQLYSAIAPQQTLDGSLDMKKFINTSNADGGISTIFMQSLGVTRLYNPDGTLSANGQKVIQSGNGFVSTSLKIILTGITSIIIMVTTALSLFLASLAFIVRFVILIFLLAFSPIFFASYVVPEIDQYAGLWRKYLKEQLIFMPVYLLLMYFALSVLTSTSIFKDGYVGSLSPSGNFLSDLMILAVNAVLVIVMLNLPLLGAMSMGAMMPKWADKVGADAIWKKVGGWTGGIAGRGTIGYAGNYLDKKLDKSRFGNSLFGRDLRAVTTGAAAKAKFGSDRSYEDIAKTQKEVTKKQRELDRGSHLQSLMSSKSTTSQEYKDAMSKMNEKERLALGSKVLKDPNIVKHLKKSDFEAIAKSDDISADDQAEIVDARKAALVTAAKNDDVETLKFMMGNMSDDDKRTLSKTREEALHEAVEKNPVGVGGSKTVEAIVNGMSGKELMGLDDVVRPAVIAFLKPSQLKEMNDEGIDNTKKKAIGEAIAFWDTNHTRHSGGSTHKALSFMNKPENHHWWN
jgi:hypothetical protein